MNFRKLEVYGFKSFADKLEVKFDDGITAIVGPNGCGKSNVADSMRWVMGEQSAKSLRGSNMADLIFSGTEKRKSLSYCEVSLHFDNTNRIFPVDFNEVVISRKLYRNGDSEYLLNKNNCRLKDIQDLLRGSGLGRDGYSIIGQGKIDEILSAKPEDRRAIFEEAAGVSRFKLRKVESERKLARTRDSLSRINDIIGELENQLEPLTKQAETARKYLDLKERLKTFEINTYLYQYDSASESKQKVSDRIESIDQEIAQKNRDYAKAADGYEKAMQDINSLDKTIDDLREELLALTVDLTKQSGELRLLNEKLGYLKEQNTRLADEINKYRTELENSTTERNKKTALCTEKTALCVQIRNTIDELNEQYFKIVDELTAGEDDAEESNNLVMTAMDKLSDIKANMSRLIAEKAALEDKLAELQKRISVLNSKNAEDAENYSKTNGEVDALQKAVDSQLAERAELSEKYQKAMQKINAVAVELDRISAIYHTKKAQHQFLAHMSEEYNGYQESVKKLLKDADKNPDLSEKMEGVISKLIHVPEKYEAAIEAALGNILQNIVTKTDSDAQYLVGYLKSKKYGRVTFLPMNTVRPRQLDERTRSKLGKNGVFGVAADLIEFDNKYSDIIMSMLGTTIVVESIDDAVALARETSYSFKIVTLDGDITFPGGAITGGSRKAELDNILSAGRTLAKLTDELEGLEKSVQEGTATRDKLAAFSKQASEQLSKSSTEIHQKELILAAEREKCNKLSASLAETENILSILQDEEKTTAARLDEINNDLGSVEKYENILKNEKDSAGENRRMRQQQFEQLRSKREELHNTVTQSKINLASVESEITALETDIDRLKQSILTLGTAIEQNDVNIKENEASISAAEEGIRNFEKQIDNSGNDRAKELRLKLSDLDTYKHTLQNDFARFDAEKMTLMQELSQLNDKRSREEYLMEKVDSDILTMQERIEDEYQLSYEMCLPYREEEYDLNRGIQEANRLKRQIQNLGYVNVNAIEDSKLVGERYFEKVEQRDDLAKGEADLLKIIEEMTKEVLQKFNTEFARIQENFVKVFRELFGGGNAQLILLENEDPLQAGIEIVAEPPGKTLQSISLLSGGERALTAIAILFSILKLRPMPFCVLDEIEAALDDSNAQRFAKYLHRFSENTQFIVITHRKPTMELADNLYGVTMEEKGVSKIVSVKLSEAMHTAKEN